MPPKGGRSEIQTRGPSQPVPFKPRGKRFLNRQVIGFCAGGRVFVARKHGKALVFVIGGIMGV